MAPHSKEVVYRSGGSDSVYRLGMIGAWVYYIGRAKTPRLRMLGFFKGLVWPVMLVYEMLNFFTEELPLREHLAPTQPVQTSGQVQARASKPSVRAKTRPARKPVGSAKPKTKKAAQK